MIKFSRLDQNDDEIQDGRETQIYHSSVNFNCYVPVWIIRLKNMAYFRVASMVFEKAGGRGIVWRCSQQTRTNLF
jgi:hypothetical protein